MLSEDTDCKANTRKMAATQQHTATSDLHRETAGIPWVYCGYSVGIVWVYCSTIVYFSVGILWV